LLFQFCRIEAFSFLVGVRDRHLMREKIGVQKVVAELSFWIVLRCQLDETAQLFISRPELRRQQREQLAPVRAGLNGREFLFDDGKQTPDRGPVLLPREVK
jgi:hypothetical protein